MDAFVKHWQDADKKQEIIDKSAGIEQPLLQVRRRSRD